MGYLRIGGVDLYSEIAGDGEPVLLLHGGFCSLESLRAQSDALVPDHRVYAFERPGHGRSADLDEEYSYARGIADTLAYLDAVGLASAHVVGYSDGAILGLLLALDHPERVRSLTAISANLDPSAFTDTAGAVPVLRPLPKEPEPEPAPETETAEPEPDVERLHYERLSPDGPEHADAVLAKLFRLWTSEPRIDPKDLDRIVAPVLVMSGDRDTIRPDHSLLIAASIPGAQLCVVPGTSHNLIAERPELISLLVRGFLEQVRQRPAASA
jgi:pimeloyl-ACP methyl ester carboxylesterase